ncbi:MULTISPECIES: SCP2 sterol-binding domain-containing protein [Psychrobacter]|uniref:SCP2 sterol-binding domain-containing protein n=1 Tax=Psychrobacter TaxID=497 RepID=UPI00146AE86A|nr:MULTISPECIES: SCP2 sterol-binding domain-containing protein [Psychrobacter]
MAVFLTEDWFNEVDQIASEVGELNLPPALANMTINLKVLDSSGDVEANYAQGYLHKGLTDAATTTLILDRETLQNLISGFDINEVMGAFMTGKIRVEGDMSQLMALQTARPSAEQKQLFKRVYAMTEMA